MGRLAAPRITGADEVMTMMHMFTFSIVWFLLPFFLVTLGTSLIGRANRRFGSVRRGTGQREIASFRLETVEPTIYRLAKRLDGRLTVSDVVVETGLPVREAEQTLQTMTDSVRVRMEVDERGVVTYEFTELLS